MFDMQQMVNVISDIGRDSRKEYHLKLGELVNFLSELHSFIIETDWDNNLLDFGN